VARFGGDEFAVIQVGAHGAAEASALAQRIIAALGEPYQVEGQPVVVGVSVGICLVTEPGALVDQILKDADIALYKAKAEGRGTYRFFEPLMARDIQEREELKADLRSALGRNEFSLCYQPLVDMVTSRINGFEALLRWRHPVRGNVSPADFIPLAEASGGINDIGRWVLTQACRDAVTWPSDITVAVNLSPVQFRSESLVGDVAAALAGSGLCASRLQLEITESVLLQDSEANLAVLHALREVGAKIAMDDFGTGYSSLSYLRSFPFDKIKIDRAFVADLPDGAESQAIVSAVVGLGHSLDMTTTAEGVETCEQYEALRELGCREGQGYLYSPPVPAGEVGAIIQSFGRPQRNNRQFRVGVDLGV
jgi:predicted signal transduction protein with EAL and GGDEF domain